MYDYGALLVSARIRSLAPPPDGIHCHLETVHASGDGGHTTRSPAPVPALQGTGGTAALFRRVLCGAGMSVD